MCYIPDDDVAFVNTVIRESKWRQITKRIIEIVPSVVQKTTYLVMLSKEIILQLKSTFSS
jgi:hypothetical protein